MPFLICLKNKLKKEASKNNFFTKSMRAKNPPDFLSFDICEGELVSLAVIFTGTMYVCTSRD